MVAVSAGLSQLPQIWLPFPAPYPYTGSEGPVRGASTGLERPTPWISDLTGERLPSRWPKRSRIHSARTPQLM